MFINLLSFYMHTCMFPVLYIPAGFPIEWKRSEKQFELVRVYNTSREYRKVKSHFCNTLPKATVIRIERIQNTVLWSKYHRKMADLKSDPQLPTGEKSYYFTVPEIPNPVMCLWEMLALTCDLAGMACGEKEITLLRMLSIPITSAIQRKVSIRC